MSIIVVGLSYKTAPIEVREKITLKAADIPLDEVVMISTCNRLEVYAVSEDCQAGRHSLETALNAPLDMLYFKKGRDAIRHLMAVTAGLESMVLGEPQILGQVARSLESAQAAGTIGTRLNQLFQQALHLGKQVRTETSISRHTISLGQSAVRLAQTHLGDLKNARVVIVGVGEIGELAAHAFTQNGAEVTIINRTLSRAESLAQAVNGKTLAWENLRDSLAWADVIVTASGAPTTIIQADEVEAALNNRNHRPLLFIDLAVPRDVAESVGDLPDVQRYDIDDLHAIVNANTAERQKAAAQAQEMVEEAVQEFIDWSHSRKITPLIADFRRNADIIAAEEVAKTLQRLDGLSPEQQAIITRMAQRIANKVLHEPTLHLKAMASKE